jgi:hypothetical protein
MKPNKEKGKKRKKADDLPGYPHYSPLDDIYSNERRVPDVNPDDGSILKDDNQPEGLNEKDYTNTMTGDDLDVPGADLDDDMEDIGEEDEENNYYS